MHPSLHLGRRVNFGQINLAKRIDAARELSERNYDVVMITEPHTAKNKVTGLKHNNNDNIVADNKSKPRACIRTSLPCWKVEGLTSKDTAVAIIKTEEGQICVASIYLDIKKESAREEKLIDIANCCKKGNLPFIAGIDTNAHSSMWGSADDNKRGNELEELLLELNLHVLNQGGVNTYSEANKGTVIDITIVNEKAIEMWDIDDWRVDTSESDSDHRYITFSSGRIIPKQDFSRNLKKANWEIFRGALEKTSWPNVLADSNIDELAELFHDKIREALDLACPLRPTMNRKPNKWWTKELEKLRSKVRLLRDNRNLNNIWQEKYKNARAEYKTRIWEAKRKSWQDFCSNSESSKDLSNLMKVLGGKTDRVMSLLNHEGEESCNPEEAVDILLKTHFPEMVDWGEIRTTEPERRETAKDNLTDKSGIDEFITLEKVIAALKTFGNLKAPGPDELRAIILKNLDTGAVKFLTEIYKLSILSCKIPARWKEMKVVFIPKPGKEDYSSPRAYRPITLSSFVLKGLERIVLWYMKDRVVTENLASQHAYTRGLSTETALSEAVDFIESAFYRKKITVAVGLDCSGAFDWVSFRSMKEALERKGTPSNITEWYDELLKSRKVTVELNGVTKAINPGRGSPQGGILSPMVWNLVMDSLLTKFKRGPIRAVGYADDLLLMGSGIDPRVVSEQVQGGINATLKWGKEKGLTFNPKKTQAMVFERARKYTANVPQLRMGKERLEYSDTIQYLGMTLQKRLCWTDHVKNQISKVNRLVGMARRTIGLEWGLTPDKIEWIYKAIARPKIAYGALVWGADMVDNIREILNRTQNKFIRIGTGALRSTPAEVMNVVSRWLPLDLHVEEMAIRARIRTKHLLRDTWDGMPDRGTSARGHRRILDKKAEGIRLTEKQPNLEYSWIEWDNFAEGEENLRIYTDGACNEFNSGYAFVAFRGRERNPEYTESKPLGKSHPYQVELFAVKASLEWLKTNRNKLNRWDKVTILSDSRSVVLALKSTQVRNAMVEETLTLLMELKKYIKINLQWVRGHSNVSGNNLADFLAKEAARTQPGERTLPITLEEVKTRIRYDITKKWQERWETFDHETARKFYREVSLEKPQTEKRITNRDLGILYQVVSGHGLFGEHLSKWRKNIDTNCQWCLEEEETSWHVWRECVALEGLRSEITSNGTDSLEEQILKFFKTDQVWEVLKQRGISLNKQQT